jgi:hypothetical protein
MTKPDFIICAPLHFVFASNGVLALVKLARAIEKTGRSAYVCTYVHGNGQDTILAVDFDTYVCQNEQETQLVGTVRRATKEFGIQMLKDFSPQRIGECYVVYPEAIRYNPLNAKRVIRYFLNKDTFFPAAKVQVGPDDFILAHSRVMHPDPHHVCYFAELNPLFNSEGSHPAQYRQMDLCYLGKGPTYGYTHIVPETVVITRTWPTTKEQLAILLRNCRFFYTADACSNLNVEALACGAIPAFLDYGPWKPEEIDSAEPGVFPRLYDGIAAGDNFYEEFEVARAGYLGRLGSYIDGWETSVAQMIEKVDAHFQRAELAAAERSLSQMAKMLGA